MWTDAGPQLDESYRLASPGELDVQRTFAEVRAAWSQAGRAISARVEGKRQPPWCRESRPDDSDGLRVWIDTRDTHNIHRATRFCHQFMFMPSGAGRGLDEPCAEQLLINRARENAKPVRPGQLAVRREKRVDGYLLEAHIPSAALTGFDPSENPRLGFTYAIFDRELGEQTFLLDNQFPYQEDPSVWATLDLVR
ncbi:MAG: hypothetical protein WD403_13770 [Pirellulales bacterium]